MYGLLLTKENSKWYVKKILFYQIFLLSIIFVICSIINQYFSCFALLVCLFEIESHVPIVRLELTT